MLLIARAFRPGLLVLGNSIRNAPVPIIFCPGFQPGFFAAYVEIVLVFYREGDVGFGAVVVAELGAVELKGL
ncbi:MAG TPA: hypothetical protein VNZ86_16520 [Bacteroidia bacterium]|jgi:hypothetical protein|nr:hypothetical protein [Bacteroidia bacterium]